MDTLGQYDGVSQKCSSHKTCRGQDTRMQWLKVQDRDANSHKVEGCWGEGTRKGRDSSRPTSSPKYEVQRGLQEAPACWSYAASQEGKEPIEDAMGPSRSTSELGMYDPQYMSKHTHPTNGGRQQPGWLAWHTPINIAPLKACSVDLNLMGSTHTAVHQ